LHFFIFQIYFYTSHLKYSIYLLYFRTK